MKRFLACLGLMVCLTGAVRAVGAGGGVAVGHAADHAASHAAAMAAQAIAASQQAAMMYQMLMMKGVMDFFQRKRMEKANRELADKMEKIQKEVQTGKLSPDEFEAIKSAIEDTYAKYSKTDLPKDKSIQADPNNANKAFKPDSSALSDSNLVAKEEGASKLGLQSGSSDLAKLETGNSNLKTQDGKGTSSSDSSQASSQNGSLMPAFGGGLAMMAGSQHPEHPTITIQNSMTAETTGKNRGLGPQLARELAGQDAIESISLPSEDGEKESMNPFGLEDSGEDSKKKSRYSLLSGQSPEEARFGASFLNLLKPIKFQKNPFSKKLQTEEGLHLGLLALVLGMAFILGRSLNTEKKTPKVIPEVVLAPEKKGRKKSKALVVQSVRTRSRRT